MANGHNIMIISENQLVIVIIMIIISVLQNHRVRGFHEAPNCNSQEEIFDIEEECCTDKIVQPKASITHTTMLKQCTSYIYTSSAIGYF